MEPSERETHLSGSKVERGTSHLAFVMKQNVDQELIIDMKFSNQKIGSLTWYL